MGRPMNEDGRVSAICPDNDNGDRTADSEAVPDARHQAKGDTDVTALTLEVDGEIFSLRLDEFGASYAWLSGPNPGYGFGTGPIPNLSLDWHRERIRNFLAMVDPTTGYIEGD